MWKYDRDTRVLSMQRRGYSLKHIAECEGVTYQMIQKILKRVKKKRWELKKFPFDKIMSSGD